MREIRFRVWDKLQKVMLYYDKDVVPLLTLSGVLVDAGMTGHSTNVSYRFVLMQYIGLKLKSGQELYEGDGGDYKQGGCFFCDGRYVIRYGEFIEDGKEFNGFYIDWLDENGLSQSVPDWLDHPALKFDKNIHENPELLGDTQ